MHPVIIRKNNGAIDVKLLVAHVNCRCQLLDALGINRCVFALQDGDTETLEAFIARTYAGRKL